jgi:hypothetical protein
MYNHDPRLLWTIDTANASGDTHDMLLNKPDFKARTPPLYSVETLVAERSWINTQANTTKFV